LADEYVLLYIEVWLTSIGKGTKVDVIPSSLKKREMSIARRK